MYIIFARKKFKPFDFSLSGSNGETCKTIGLDTTADDFERGATDVFTNLGDECKTTAFNNGISKVVVEHSSKDAWCFLNTVIELDSGEKYLFENPNKNRKGKKTESDWLRNEKREGKPVKMSCCFNKPGTQNAFLLDLPCLMNPGKPEEVRTYERKQESRKRKKKF